MSTITSTKHQTKSVQVDEHGLRWLLNDYERLLKYTVDQLKVGYHQQTRATFQQFEKHQTPVIAIENRKMDGMIQ